MYRAFAEEHDIRTEDIHAIARAVPLSRSQPR
jgi:hypothetical protein